MFFENIRYPGQYYDAETGLHYNWHRYYDPSTGRYLTPDPIGLEGGINLYSYALQNPVNYIDPFGLDSLKNLENAETVAKLLDAIEKNPAAHPKDLIPNPSKSMISLLDAISKSLPCKEMLTASSCEKFKKKYDPCWQDLQFKYGVLLQHGLDVQGALTDRLFDTIEKQKRSKVCCEK